jgi:AcrR family transcriptional regulator
VNRTKERILEVSSELFRRQGLAGTGIKQILGQAGAPFSSLYHHFPGGKDQLAAETIEREGRHFARLVGEVIAAEPDLVSGIRAAFVGAGATLESTGYADACPIETVALEVASTNERLRLATAEVFESWIVGLTATLTHAGSEPAPARALAVTILSALEGAFVLARASRTTEALHACAEHLSHLVEFALPAAAASTGTGERDGHG